MSRDISTIREGRVNFRARIFMLHMSVSFSLAPSEWGTVGYPILIFLYLEVGNEVAQHLPYIEMSLLMRL